MKFAKLLQFLVIICAFSNLLSAQTPPSLENGWKPYGSYEGSQLDTVNLMNGNLMLHAPLIPGAAQRGSLQISTSLYLTSQDWQVVCKPGCAWSKGGTGVKIVQTPYLRVHRTVNNDYVYANTVVSDGFAYTIVGPDDSTHSLHGVAGTEDSLGEPTQFDSVDLSGYHLTMSVPDANHSTVLTHFTVTDRDGNKYEGDFGPDFATSATCPHAANFMISSPGHFQPVVDDSPVGDQYCPQTGYASSVTDRNGNQMTLAGGLGAAFIASDTLARAPATWPITTSYGDCISPYATTQAGLYSYQDPNGITRNIKICYSEFPIHTAFNVSGVAEAVTSTDPNSGLHFIAAASVILADGSYWAFNYDSYGEVSSIHLPTGGTLSYLWRTIAFPACPGGPRAPLSRSIQTRTLDDNRGHTSQWSYNWSAVSSTSLVNTVTDPAGNDSTHNFTDVSTHIGQGGSCKFYETSTISYKGSASANIPLERVDTSYNVTAITVDDSNPGIGNIFATDVLTTVYPSGKVKKSTHGSRSRPGNRTSQLWQRN
jgi:YD repeat-containing protein